MTMEMLYALDVVLIALPAKHFLNAYHVLPRIIVNGVHWHLRALVWQGSMTMGLILLAQLVTIRVLLAMQERVQIAILAHLLELLQCRILVHAALAISNLWMFVLPVLFLAELVVYFPPIVPRAQQRAIYSIISVFVIMGIIPMD
jgi:hypothetical protein